MCGLFREIARLSHAGCRLPARWLEYVHLNERTTAIMPTSLRFLSTLSFAVCLAMPLHAGAQDAHRVSFTQGSDTSYALVREGQRTTYVGRFDSDDKQVDTLKKQYSGNFIWFRQGGKAYIVRDAATLNKVTAAWAPLDPISADMDRLDAKMRVQSDAMTTLSRAMEAATRGAKAGNIEMLGKQMESQGKTMDGLGKEMDAVGKQMDVQSKRADAIARNVLEIAVANGTAAPLPIR